MTISSIKTLLAAALASVLTWGCGIPDEGDQDLGRTSSAVIIKELPALLTCGNGVCDGYGNVFTGEVIMEDRYNCPQDCGWCGDGVKNGSETCDIAITSGDDKCPTLCPTTTETCKQYVLKNEGTCQARCVLESIPNCCGNGECEWTKNASGVYVSGETRDTCPDDCSCGNGTVDPYENCDKGIDEGETGACPTECTLDSQVYTGSVATCTARCVVDDGNVDGGIIIGGKPGGGEEDETP
jgi:hypothetical protein